MKTALLIVGITTALFSCRRADPPQPVLPVPSPTQMRWHEMEMNAFIHFTTNTFTDLEWGMGDEHPAVFNPTDFNAGQWVSTLKDAGFKGIILTCKHHDGFCLWPSKYTGHSVKNSPFMDGDGDVVKAVSDACREYGLKFGVYLSPWDRNHPKYGHPEYITYYRNQLREIFENYGPVFEMWFDGANGGTGYYGGANEKRSIDGARYYDWPGTLAMVKDLQPDVIFFSDAGPGVRWVGNERGIAGETNWNMITPDTLFAGKPGIERLLGTGNEAGTHWIPAEVDVSIRPGWFYHEREDSLVKSPETLFDIYLTSVGRGSTLLLNVPPDKRGRLHPRDVAALRAWRKMLDDAFATNLALGAAATTTNVRGDDAAYGAGMALDNDTDTYWATDDDVVSGSLTIDFGEPKDVNYVVMQEHIRLGQRVRSFSVEAWGGAAWTKIAEGTTIGYKRIVKVGPTRASKVRVNVLDSRACPLIATVAIY